MKGNITNGKEISRAELEVKEKEGTLHGININVQKNGEDEKDGDI